MARNLPLPFAQAWPWTAFVALIFLANYGARSALSPLLVSIEMDLHVSHSQATSLLMLQGVGFSIALGISGLIMSSLRPAHMAVLSLVGGGSALMLMPLVTTLAHGQIIFLLFGLLVGLYFPAGMAILNSIVFPKDLGKAVGIHELAPNIGFIIMPLCMQLALAYTDWRGAFSYVGISMILIGLSFLFFGRGGQQCTPPTSLAGVSKLFHTRSTWLFALLLTMCLVGEFTIYSVLQLYLVSDGGYSPEKANLIMSLSRVLTPMAVFAAGFAADTFNPITLLRASLLLHGVALILMSLNNSILALSGVCLQSFSIAFSFPVLFKIMSNCISIREQPLLLSFTMPVAGIIATGLIPWLLGLCGQYASFGLGFAILGVLSVVSVWALEPFKKIERV